MISGEISQMWRDVAVDRMTLQSGLRVAWDPTPSVGTSALGLFIDVGSRDEWNAVWGASHFLEHAVFKGAGTRSGREIAEVGDRLGAEINAFTTRDYTCFYGKAMDPMLDAVYEVIESLVTEPWLAAADIDRERQVIVEEMRESYDDASDRVAEALLWAVYDDPGFTHDILGTQTSIEGLSQPSLRRFHQQFYVPSRMVLALAGEGGKAVMDRLIAGNGAVDSMVRTAPKVRPREVLLEEDREQVQVLLGVVAPNWGSEESYPCDLLTTLLGGQTSSRLWQRLREEEGIVYSVDADYQAEPDWALMTIGIGVHPSRLEQAVRLIGDEIHLAIANGFSADEIRRAKVQLRAGLWFGLETVDHRMLHLGRHLLRHRIPSTIPEMEAKIDAVEAEDLSQMMSQLWADSTQIAVAAVGPLGNIVNQGIKHLL